MVIEAMISPISSHLEAHPGGPWGGRRGCHKADVSEAPHEGRVAATDLEPGEAVESGDLRATGDGIEVKIRAFVPASDDDMPVRLEFAPRIVGLLDPARADGVANTWITVHTRI